MEISRHRLFRRKAPRKHDCNIIFRDWSDLEDLESLGLDPSAETVLSFLKDLGKFAIQLEGEGPGELKEQCKAWIRRLAQAVGQEEDGTGEADWRGAQRFFKERRREEKVYVEDSFAGFKETIWEFMTTVSTSVSEDSSSDSEIHSRLQHLKSTVEDGDLKDLRQEAMEVIQSIGRSLQERRTRQRSQLKDLGKKLKTMRSELMGLRSRLALDPLTGIYNRQALDEQLERLVEYSLFSGESPALVILDGDNFKGVNDVHGHQAGDLVLKTVANVCVKNFPRKTDFVARMGGDEFVVIISDATPAVSQKMALRLIERVREHSVVWKDSQIDVSISVGIAHLRDGETPASWMERADQALLSAKSQGKGQLVAADTAAGASEDETLAC